MVKRLSLWPGIQSAASMECHITCMTCTSVQEMTKCIKSTMQPHWSINTLEYICIDHSRIMFCMLQGVGLGGGYTSDGVQRCVYNHDNVKVLDAMSHACGKLVPWSSTIKWSLEQPVIQAEIQTDTMQCNLTSDAEKGGKSPNIQDMGIRNPSNSGH